MTDELPSILLLALLLIIGTTNNTSIGSVPAAETIGQLIITDGAIVGYAGPFTKAQALASMIGPEIRHLFEGKDGTFVTIAQCESTFQAEACSYDGCGSGMGLFQIIPSTWNIIVEAEIETNNGMIGVIPDRCRVPITSVRGFRTDKSHPIFDPVCNAEAAGWLYAEGGSSPWGYAGAEWGSWECWGDS